MTRRSELANKIRALPRVSDVYIPQDLDYPSLQLNIDRGGPTSWASTSARS